MVKIYSLPELKEHHRNAYAFISTVIDISEVDFDGIEIQVDYSMPTYAYRVDMFVSGKTVTFGFTENQLEIGMQDDYILAAHVTTTAACINHWVDNSER